MKKYWYRIDKYPYPSFWIVIYAADDRAAETQAANIGLGLGLLLIGIN